MRRRMHIVVACSSLCSSLGGSERAATNLANAMNMRGHTVTLLSLTHGGRHVTPCYELSSGVRHLPWERRGKHDEICQLRQRLLEDGADVFLSMESGSDHLFWAMVCMGSGVPFICSERCDPVLFTEHRVWNRAGRLAVLSGADVIHELLPAYVHSVPECFHQRVHVIPNAAPNTSKPACPEGMAVRRKSILYMARFDEQKRPLLLVDAFCRVAAHYPDWDLVMWGHGPEEDRVQSHIKTKGMQHRIHMRGRCRDAPSAHADAQIYCLPSAYEGFPNTVLEAMCAGLPVVGFVECAGVRDVVQHGRTGLVVEPSTPQSLAEALVLLMDDASLRRRMGDAGRLATEKYAPVMIYDQWEELFIQVLQHKGQTVMDDFTKEPFASRARLSAAARREWVFRNFGDPMPFSTPWLWQRGVRLCRQLSTRAWGLLLRRTLAVKEQIGKGAML